ncbi:MAG: hypothetical protein ACT4OO_16145 [Nitrospiraceae bacterium]
MMSSKQAFWSVPSGDGEPDLWVCMSCLGEAFRRKVPNPNCPTCHGVSTYEAFSIDAIREWGTEDLIAKASAASADPDPSSVDAGGLTPVEATD